jgi:hypothetical protein
VSGCSAALSLTFGFNLNSPGHWSGNGRTNAKDFAHFQSEQLGARRLCFVYPVIHWVVGIVRVVCRFGNSGPLTVTLSLNTNRSEATIFVNGSPVGVTFEGLVPDEAAPVVLIKVHGCIRSSFPWRVLIVWCVECAAQRYHSREVVRCDGETRDPKQS